MTQEMVTLPVQNMNDLQLTGGMLAKSGMFGIKNDGAGMVIAMTCYQEGITPLEFLRTYHIIENKPAMRSDAMTAKFRQIGGKIKIISRTRELAKAEFEFEKSKTIFEYSIEDAKLEELVFMADKKTIKDNWRKRPHKMLWARLTSDAVRALAPEIVAGVYTPEEVESFDEVQKTDEKVVKSEDVKVFTQKKEEVVEVKAEVCNEKHVKSTGSAEICPIAPKEGVPFEELESKDLKVLIGRQYTKRLNDAQKRTITSILNKRNYK